MKPLSTAVSRPTPKKDRWNLSLAKKAGFICMAGLMSGRTILSCMAFPSSARHVFNTSTFAARASSADDIVLGTMIDDGEKRVFTSARSSVNDALTSSWSVSRSLRPIISIIEFICFSGYCFTHVQNVADRCTSVAMNASCRVEVPGFQIFRTRCANHKRCTIIGYRHSCKLWLCSFRTKSGVGILCSSLSLQRGDLFSEFLHRSLQSFNDNLQLSNRFSRHGC